MDASCRRFDDAIEFTALRCQERAGHVVGVFGGKLGAHGGNIFARFFGSLDLVTEQNVDRTLTTHNRDFGGWPSQVDVGSELFRAHNDVSTAVSLASDDGDQRNGCLGVCIEQLGTASNHASPLLVGARQVARNVDEGEDRNREGVAEANETRGLLAGVNVQCSCHCARLVGDDANACAVDASKTNQDVRSEQWLNLEKLVVINNRLDDGVHVVRLVW